MRYIIENQIWTKSLAPRMPNLLNISDCEMDCEKSGVFISNAEWHGLKTKN
jgi:hypothetical protein